MIGALHILISAEPIAKVGSLVITNSMAASLAVSTLIVGFALAVRANLSSNLGRPTLLQNIGEILVEGIYGLVYGVTNNHKKADRFMPLILAFFVFILLNNWLGLLPGVGTIGFTETAEKEHVVSLLPETITLPVRQAYAATVAHGDELVAEVEAPLPQESAKDNAVVEPSHSTFVPLFRAGTADINTTLALALITMFSVQMWGVTYLGLAYFKKFFDFSTGMNFFVGILELVSDTSKVISFAFRLFGNVFAGEVLLMVIGALVPLVIPMVFYGLEIFVGGMQALVFSLLSLVFYNMATTGHEEH